MQQGDPRSPAAPAPQRAYSVTVNPEPTESLFAALRPDSPCDWALSLSVAADEGHRDELRGDDPHGLAPSWAEFFEHIGKSLVIHCIGKLSALFGR